MLRSISEAARRLQRPANRGYVLAALATFALGIAAVISVYSVMHRVLLEPLAITDESRVVRLAGHNDARGVTDFAVSKPDFDSWSEHARSFSAMAAVKLRGVNLMHRDGPERRDAVLASVDIWQVLGISPLLGRVLADSEDDRSAALLISESFWRERFDRQPDVLGRLLIVEGRARSVVGVVPDDVGFSVGASVWLPLEVTGREAENRGDRRLTVLARLADDASLQTATSEINAIATQLASEHPQTNEAWAVAVVPVREWLVGADDRSRLLMLLAAVALLLLVICSNVAGLQLARAADRQAELGLRQAIGADRARLRRDVLAETLLLVAAGAAIALPLTAMVLHAFGRSLQTALPRIGELSIEPAIAGAAIAACAITAVVFGWLPAMLVSRARPLAAFTRQRNDLGRRGAPLRTALVVGQFAIATVLLSASLGLGERLQSLANTDLGFATEHMLTARIALPRIESDDDLAEQRRVLDRLVAEVRSIPGVRVATIASETPLGSIDTQSLVAPGPMPVDATPAERHVQASWRIVGADYFRAFGIPLLSGRAFLEDEEVSDAIVLSRGVAERVFGGEDAVGRMITMGNGQRKVVVGVAGDAHQRGVADGASPTVYFPTVWYLWESMTLAVRSEGDPLPLLAEIRERAARVYPDRPLYDIRTMDDAFAAATAGPRIQAAVVSAFAAVAVLIAAVGIGAVSAYLIARRRSEFALRIALGASPAGLRLRVLADGAVLAVAGIIAGALVMLAIAQLALPELAASTHLSTALAIAATTLLATCLLACWWPAARAASIAPALALRGN